MLGGNPCSLSTDCPLNSAGQVCEFTGDPAIGTPGTCSALFGPGAVASGFCGNPGQTCTAAVCDPVGNPGGGAFCGQAFGQACLGGICQAVDLSDGVEIGSTTETFFEDPGAANDPNSYTYKVFAVDACGREE